MSGKKEAMRRILTEAFSEGKVDVLDEVMAPGFINHNAPPGLDTGVEGVKKVIQMEHRGIPDFTYEIVHEFEDGDFVIQLVRAHGTHLGAIFGTPPTGRKVNWQEIHIAKLDEDGRCIEHWACNDMAALWVQIGRATAPQVEAQPVSA
jgi:predicted ester cyclase